MMLTDPRRPGGTHSWRHARDVLDSYDADRVLSEALADDLVNDLVGRPARGRRTHRGRAPHPRAVGPAERLAHLTVVRGVPEA